MGRQGGYTSGGVEGWRSSGPTMGDHTDDKVDILVYVALSEEFSALWDELGNGFQPVRFADASLTAFVGTILCSPLQREFKVAIVPGGKMGNTRAATNTSHAINKFRPRDVVVLGIAGSVSNDLQPGDVFIPDSVTEYLANSATTGAAGSWSFKTSGNSFPSSARLLNNFQYFAQTQEQHFERWQSSARRRRADLVSSRMERDLDVAGLAIRSTCRLFAGEDRKLASGPAVGKGEAFLQWLSEVDRKVAAMEMESAGVYDAAMGWTPAPRTVAIRGVSDYADSRKHTIETIAGSSFRDLATKNAISFFLHAVEAGLFEPEVSLTVQSVAAAKEVALAARVRTAFVIGGQTDETDDVESEKPRLHDASLRLGALLATSGAQLIVCSPFPDSVDYYTTMGYVNARVGGVIHFCSPMHERVTGAYQRLTKRFGRPKLKFQEWRSPGPEADDIDESWSQAWLLAQLQALERADVIIALGGKASGSANTLLHLAEAKRLPIVPFTFLGGAAGRAYKRRDWDQLHPGLDHPKLRSEDGIEHSIEIANRLLLDKVKRKVHGTKRPEVIFISRAKQDKAFATELKQFLKGRGIEVLLGDDEVKEGQMILASIEQAQLRSDVCVVLWSKHYAQSPWCYDELMLAIEQQEHGNAGLWLFNLDETAVVPTKARQLPAILTKTFGALTTAAGELLD